MRFYIRQRGHHYKFFEGDKEVETFNGYWDRGWRVKLHSKIFDSEKRELATITLTKAPFFWRLNKTIYQIQIHNENIKIEVKAINAYRGHWGFKLNQNRYDFYFHFGHKKSLFKDNQQVAKYDKGAVHMWANDSAFIVANNDESKLLLLALFLTFDMGQSMNGDVNVDLGNLTGGVKEFDNNWYPTK